MSNESTTVSSSPLFLTPHRRFESRRQTLTLGLRRASPGRRHWDVEAFMESLSARGAWLQDAFSVSRHLNAWGWIVAAAFMTGSTAVSLFAVYDSIYNRVSVSASDPLVGSGTHYSWSGFHRVSEPPR